MAENQPTSQDNISPQELSADEQLEKRLAVRLSRTRFLKPEKREQILRELEKTPE